MKEIGSSGFDLTVALITSSTFLLKSAVNPPTDLEVSIQDKHYYRDKN